MANLTQAATLRIVLGNLASSLCANYPEPLFFGADQSTQQTLSSLRRPRRRLSVKGGNI